MAAERISSRVSGLAIAAVLLALPAAAGAATTVGQSPPTVGELDFCGAQPIPVDLVQLRSVSGAPYVIPAGGGVITSWQTSNVVGTSNAKFRLFTGDLTPEQPTLVPIRESAFVVVKPGAASRFNTRLAAPAGAVIGMTLQTNDLLEGCTASGAALGDDAGLMTGSTAIGVSEQVQPPLGTTRVNLSANLEPDLDLDGFGDETQDAFIDKGPKKRTAKPKATFKLRGAASYECSIDKGEFKQCASGVTYKKLKAKKHKFAVRAVTPTAELSPSTKFGWKVEKKKD